MDGILGVGPLELIIIVVLALVILGPERLPDTIRTVVKFIRRARAIGNELTTQFSEELNLLDDFNPKKILEDVAGLEKDEKFDAKSFLGIDKDDLKVGIDDKKANAKSTAKKPSVSASSTAKKTKPALGEIDPEETSAVDAVVEEPPSDSPKTTDNAAKADVSNGDSSVAKVSEAEPNSIGGSIKPSESVSANGGTSKARADLSKKQVESDVVESVTENSIAPPSMTSTQSLDTDKTSSSEERNNATEKLADVVAEEVSKNAVVESNLPADVDPEVTKDAGEV